jgi:Polyketide cyclase / dehydrase and lipid transport
MWPWIVLAIVALLVLFVLVMSVLGRRLPEEHVASLTLTLNQKQQDVWDTIADVGGHKNWVRGITKIERLADRENHEVWRQRMGRNSFVLETTVCQPPVHLVREVVDDNHNFSGDWEYELSSNGEGTRVRLTEHGRVPNALFRAMMHYLFGETTTIRGHLCALAAKFGEQARFEEGPGKARATGAPSAP